MLGNLSEYKFELESEDLSSLGGSYWKWSGVNKENEKQSLQVEIREEEKGNLGDTAEIHKAVCTEMVVESLCVSILNIRLEAGTQAQVVLSLFLSSYFKKHGCPLEAA